MAEHAARRTLASYMTGAALALVLTLIPFAAVAFGFGDRNVLVALIVIAAAIQVIVHLRWFLHLRITRIAEMNVLTVLFTFVLLVLMVGGTLWIMTDLAGRMLG